MSWGFQTFAADGSLLVDASKPMSRIYDTFIASATSSGSKSYPALAGRKFAAIATPANSGLALKTRHKLTVDTVNGVISWQEVRMSDWLLSCDTIILVIMYG